MRQHMEAKHPEEDASAEFPAEAMTEDGQPVPSGVVGQRNDWSRQHGFQMVNSRKTGGYLTQALFLCTLATSWQKVSLRMYYIALTNMIIIIVDLNIMFLIHYEIRLK